MAKLTYKRTATSGIGDQQKNSKVQRTAKNHAFRLVRPEAVEENKKQLERDKQLSEQQKQAVLAKEFKAQVKQLIENENRISNI